MPKPEGHIPHPPKKAKRVLHWLLKDELVEEILGDLEERFYTTLNRKSLKKAQFDYWYQVWQYLRLFAIKKPTLPGNQLPLLKFNLLFTWRNLKRNRLHTLLNTIGLGTGISCCIFIALFILDELSFDQHWPDKENIYRAYVNIDVGGDYTRYGFATAPMAEIFKKEFPEVEMTARWINRSEMTFRVKDQLIKDKEVILADQKLLQLLSLKAIHGDILHALDQPNTLVLTRNTAKKLFGDLNPVGETLETNTGDKYLITCVIEDFPWNSHLRPSIIITTINDQWSDPSKVTRLAYWTRSSYRTYLKLKPGTDPKVLESKFHSIYEKYFDPVMPDFSGQSWREFLADGNRYFYSLQPLDEIYLHSNFSADDQPKISGNIRFLYMFGAIGIFILGIAFINFVNLSTAKSTERIKEIGVKKVLGSNKAQIARQFLLESIVTSMIGLVVAAAICYLTLPVFNEIVEKNFKDPFFNQHHLWFYAFLGTVLTGLIAGIYPALGLAKIGSVQHIRHTDHRKGLWLRNSLVIIQFSISSLLIVGTVMVYKQLSFSQSTDLGYSRENLIVVNNAWGLGASLETFHKELVNDPEIINASALHHIPTDRFFVGTFFSDANSRHQEQKVRGIRLWVDHNMLSTFNLKLVDGRNFLADSRADSAATIINQSAASELGFKDPIGKKIKCTDGTNQEHTIIGVVSDFHTRSLKSPIGPMSLHPVSNPRRLTIKFKTGNLLGFMDKLENRWKSYVPDHIIEYEFVDDRYERLYQSEKRLSLIFNIFVVLALIIASLGLFGLSAIITSRRKKEIGIRKVLGASIQQIVVLLNSELTKPVLLSLLIGLPSGAFLMEQWLNDFAYRVSIDWQVLVGSALSCLVIAWFVVSSLTIRSARNNPTENLRYE